MKLIKNIWHYFIARLGAIIYRNPSDKLFVIGVTGTKGKTTTIELINAGLEAAHYKTALSSSLRRKVGDKSSLNTGNSMPGRFALQRFLSDAARASCKFAAIEVTSEGVAQHRHIGIDFDAAVFLNLHPEHIEAHGSFEKYKEEKLNFFRYVANAQTDKAKLFFVNKDDKYHKDFVGAAEGAGKVTLFSKSGAESNLIGEFNKHNLGAAEAVLLEIGISRETVKRAFANFPGVPGRMEFVETEPFNAVVDYAHTPDSLEAVYQTLASGRSTPTPKSGIQGRGSDRSVGDVKGQMYEHKLICVLGSAGGGRDKWKRPKFGEIAAQYCKEIILTDEDPFDEDPNQILSEIKSGISNFKSQIPNVQTVLDRKEAIRKALSLAKSGDTVIITGKGSERYIRVAGGKRIQWSDKETVLEIINNKEGSL